MVQNKPRKVALGLWSGDDALSKRIHARHKRLEQALDKLERAHNAARHKLLTKYHDDIRSIRSKVNKTKRSVNTNAKK